MNVVVQLIREYRSQVVVTVGILDLRNRSNINFV